MIELLYTNILVAHIIASMVAVGTVTVTDYLHILGLRDPKLEKRTLFVFPLLSNLIRIALALIYVTGILMVIAKPELLGSSIFITKMMLVFIVTINGFLLHHIIFPKIEKGIRRKSYPPLLLKQAALGGSLSIVTWYSIVVLAITKEIGYRPWEFIGYYLLALSIAYMVAVHMERRRRNN